MYVGEQIGEVEKRLYVSEILDRIEPIIKAGRDAFINTKTGSGKTTAIVNNLPPIVERALGRPLRKKLIITSRTAGTDSLLAQFKPEEIRKQGTFEAFLCDLDNGFHYYEGWDAITFHGLYWAIEKQEINLRTYDLIVIDEAHSLIKDSTYTGDISYGVIEWLKKYKGVRVWCSATPYLWEDSERQGFTNFNFAMFDENPQARNKAKKAIFYASSKEEPILQLVSHEVKEKGRKIFIIRRSARRAFILAEQLRNLDIEVSFVCAKDIATQVNVKELPPLSPIVRSQLEETDPTALLNIKNGKDAYVRLEDVSENQLVLPHLLEYGTFPNEVKVIVSTSILQEAINITDEYISTIITDFTDRTSIEQISGRIRMKYETFICWNYRYGKGDTAKSLKRYEKINNMTQEELREEYMREREEKKASTYYKGSHTKWGSPTSLLVVKEEKNEGIPHYAPNIYAYLTILDEHHSHAITNINTKSKKKKTNPFIYEALQHTADEENIFIVDEKMLDVVMKRDEVIEIVSKWAGTPFVETAPYTQIFINDLVDIGVIEQGSTLTDCRNILRALGVEVDERRRTNKKEAMNYGVKERTQAYRFTI